MDLSKMIKSYIKLLLHIITFKVYGMSFTNATEDLFICLDTHLWKYRPIEKSFSGQSLCTTVHLSPP